MEKINIAELLKDCPNGMELDCTIWNNVTFDHIDMTRDCPIYIRIKGDGHEQLTEYGQWNHSPNAKCVIFPKGKTTWEGFVPPCKFKDGDVLFHSDSASNGIFIFKEILQRGTMQKVICYCDYDSEDGFCLGENHTCCWTDSKILRLATKEQREILFQKMKEAGYKWNPETKTLEKLIPNKFDINTLVSFESKVLVRNDESQYWIPAFWGCKRADGYTTTFGWCKYCIPFEGNEHLLETNNDCNEYYKTWK